MLNFQATKPACSTSPRNNLAAHCRPNNLLCKQHRLLPAAPFLPPFQQCQGTEHCTETEMLSCHCPEVAGLPAGLGAGSVLLTRAQRLNIPCPTFSLTVHFSLAPQEALAHPALQLGPPTPHRQHLCFGTHGSGLILSSFRPLKVFQ